MSASLALGAQLWIADEEEVWQKATVIANQGGKTILRLDKDDSERPLPAIFYLRNEELMTQHGIKTLDDLTQLTHLHEAAVLSSLHDRFEDDAIYTFTGPILIAVNPFKKIAGLYDEETLKHYIKEGWKQTFTATKKPHVFSTAVDAYRGLCKEEINQTILISGESGAGKTESTKFVMKLLALAGSRDWKRRSPVENQVLQSNPLLEAFGNAKTLRNDNSSRFGKFIEMQFRLENDREAGGTLGRLAGARIQTYLLETVRVCRQLTNERNYHAFYQLAAATKKCVGQNIVISPELAKQLGVDLTDSLEYTLDDFSTLSNTRYLNCSGCHTLRGVDDTEEFQRTALAMHTVGISQSEQQSIWSLVGAVLFLGSIFFEVPQGNSEASEVAVDSGDFLERTSKLLGIPMATLSKCLCNRTIVVQKERYNKPLTVAQAEDTRDALARALYGTMFLQIVKQTNRSIGYQEDVKLSCGVLDIFGFECFDVNSFEQLCINFTNERLQQFFNTFIFKCEEQLYKSEGIAWDPLDFPDNQDCVDLLQGRNSGIFAMLDEECLLPKGSDQNYCARLKQAHKMHPRFGIIKTKMDWFTVNHFAGPVHYSSKGFLDKNRDQLSQDVQDAVLASTNEFTLGLFKEFLNRVTDDPSSAKKAAKKQPLTVSLEFRNQLASLMETIQKTSPHFIRCVKPNPKNRPDVFHRISVAEQLRYAGVLQAVQVSRAGYPVRDGHSNCHLEYRCLVEPVLRKKIDSISNSRERVQAMMDHLDEKFHIPKPKHGGAKSWAVGATLVFLKHEAYEILTTRRADLRHKTATRLQAYYKMFVERREFLLRCRAALIIQCHLRRFIAERELQRRREHRAALRITRFIRLARAKVKRDKLRQQILLIQSWIRGHQARHFVRTLREFRAAVKIQARWRGRQQLRKYQVYRRKVIRIQLRWRQRTAIKELRALKIKAKDATNLKAEKDKISEQLKSALEKVSVLGQTIEALRSELETEKARVRTEQEKVSQLESQLNDSNLHKSLQDDLTALAAERDSIALERDTLSAERDELISKWESQSARAEQLRKLVVTMKEDLTKTQDAPSLPRMQSMGTGMSPKRQSSIGTAMTPQALEKKISLMAGGSEAVTTDEALGESSFNPGEDPTPLLGRGSSPFVGGGVTQLGDSPAGTPIASTAAMSMPPAPAQQPTLAHMPSAVSPSKPTVVVEHYKEVVHEPSTEQAMEIEQLSRDLSHAHQNLRVASDNVSLMTQKVEEYEAQLAVHKKARHEAEEALQSALPVDASGGVIGALVRAMSPNEKSIGPMGLLQGDVLILGDVNAIYQKVLSTLRVTHQPNPEEFRKSLEKNRPNGWLEMRQFTIEESSQDLPLIFTLLQPQELDLLSEPNVKRFKRHFRFVGFYAFDMQLSEVENQYLHHPIWDKLNSSSRRFVMTSESGSADVLERFSINDVILILPDNLRPALRNMARHVRRAREQICQDLNDLRTSDGPTKLLKEKQKAQAGTLNEMISQSLMNFFSVGKARTVPRGPGRAPRSTLPFVPDLLVESLKGDEALLAESRDREASIANGELTKWHSMAVSVKTAVTCIKFAKTSAGFFLLAVATKAGPITTYKIRLTSEDRALLDLEAADAPLRTPARKSTAEGEGDDWNTAPVDAVEKWKHFEGHTKAVTSLFFTSDGTQLVSTSIDCTVRFWDLRQGYLSKIFSDSVPILIAAFLPTDPRWFLTSNQKQVVRVVDSQEGGVSQRIKVEAEIRAICFDTSGLNLIAGTKEGSLEAYEIAEGNQLSFLTKLSLTGATHAAVTCVNFCSGTQPTVVVNYCDSTIAIVKCTYTLSSVVIRQLSVKQRIKVMHTCVPLASRIISRDDHVWIVSGSEDCKVKVFARPSIQEGEFHPIADLRAHERPVLAVDVNSLNTVLATADVSGLVHLWRRVSYRHLRANETTPTTVASAEAA